MLQLAVSNYSSVALSGRVIQVRLAFAETAMYRGYLQSHWARHLKWTNINRVFSI